MMQNHRYIRFLLQLILRMYHAISTWICWMMMTIILQKVPYVDPTSDDSDDQKNDHCVRKTKKIDGTNDTDCKSATSTDTNPSPQAQWDDVLRILFPSSSATTTTTIKSNGITVLPYHIEQLHHWDCGVTCLQMIFSWLFISDVSSHNKEMMNTNITTCNDLREWMIATIQTESIWTIDLVYLLHEFCQQHQHQQREKLPEQIDTIGTFRRDDIISSYSKFTFVMMTKSSLIVNHDNDINQNNNERHENHNNKLDDSYYIHLPYYKDTFVQDRVRIQQRLRQMAVIHDHCNDDNEHNYINSDCCVPTMINNRIYQGPTGTTTGSSFLSMDQIIHCIQHENCVAIALVDNTIFTNTFSATAVTRSCTTATATATNNPVTDTTNGKPKHDHTNHNNNHAYVGHYVIIVGISYDKEHVQKASWWKKSAKDDNNTSSKLLVPSERYTANENVSTLHQNNDACCFVIYNPANRSRSSHYNSTTTPEYVSITQFERAWRAYGTDDDIIFIAKQ